LFVTHHTAKTRQLTRRLVAKAKRATIKLPKTLPPRIDAQYPQTPLSSLYKRVKKSNLDLRILRQQVVRAELMRAKAWSVIKPQLSLSASYVRSDSEVTIGTAVLTPQNLLSVQLQLQWAFLNLQAIPILQTAYLSVKQVGHTAKQVKREVLYAAARAYYGLLLADGLVTIAEQTWTNAKEHLRIAEARLQAKVTPELAVTRAQIDVARAWQSYIQAQNALHNTRLSIAILLNQSSYEIRPVRPTPPGLPAGDLKSWRRMSLQRRQEVKAARLAVQVAEKGVTQKWMAYLPTVAAVSSVQGSNAGGFANRNFQWSISLVAQLKLYSGGVRHLEVREAHSKLLQARLELAKSTRQAGVEVSQAALTVQTAKVTLQLAKKQLLLAKRSHKLTEDRYKAGVATPVEVSDALTALQSARIGALREQLNYELALLALRRALGLFQP
jgi:outer membrane protein TolC